MDRRWFLTLAFVGAARAAQTRRRKFTAWATAHSQEGTTADGGVSRIGVIAADPVVLPLGSRVRIGGAGPYSGVYLVKDTGRAIKGREVDIYMRSGAEARKFGRKRVTVTVLDWGESARR